MGTETLEIVSLETEFSLNSINYMETYHAVF